MNIGLQGILPRLQGVSRQRGDAGKRNDVNVKREPGFAIGQPSQGDQVEPAQTCEPGSSRAVR
jgi:hypothetical protein